MGDSDDEYDRKRRDKFRGERGSGGGGGGGAGGDNYRAERRDDRGRGRDDWADRGRARPDYRDYRGGGRDRFSPDRGGPAKRMRPEWGEDGRPRFGGHDPYGPYGGGGGGWGGHHDFGLHGGHDRFGGHQGMHPRSGAGPDAQNNGDLQTQPPMLTLKQFLSNQDDSISDSDAINKYNDYKQDFRRQQLNEFFVAHKDEEWFKIKYHPQESLKRKEEQINFLKRRAEVFNELLENNSVASVNVDTTQTEKLLHLLDTVVIKLEGGSDEDLKVLDEKTAEVRPMDAVYNAKATFVQVTAPTATTNTVVPLPKRSSPHNDSTEENWDNDETVASDSPKKKNPFTRKSDETIGETLAENTTNSMSRKIEDDALQKASSYGDDNSDDDANIKNAPNDDDGPKSPDQTGEDEDNDTKTNKRGRSQSESSSSSSSSSDSDDENKADESKEEQKADVDEKSTEGNGYVGTNTEEIEMSDGKVDEEKISDNTEKKDENDDVGKESDPVEMETIDLVKEVDEKPKLRALHRTSSVFLRNLAPTITKSEVEGMCKRYNGFLRVAIADPLVERRWFRRGWVTFQRDVNIKEICWNLNNIRLRDCELGAIVNRDLSRRVRPINGITAHKSIVRSDIKLCAKIAFNLDTKAGLWTDGDGGNAATGNGIATFGLNSQNPVLQNITDYLIEEASAEEDELLGLSGGDSSETDGELLDRDPSLITVLDKMILYLRVVHSIDFYNHCEYPYEDEMPNRCGIIHARGPAPQNKITQTEIQEYTRNFESKMSSFLAKSLPIEESELKKLGCKDTDDEVEKFVAANTQELGKDKWLCPLSGKKFKGPDFIRKHIFNKHAEKVDEVKKEVEYFNNYLQDPKRPQLPEHPGNTRKMAPDMQQHPPGFRPGYHGQGYGAPYAGYAPPMASAPRARGGGFGGRRELPMEHQRRVIGYQDLDAPDYDIFP